MLTQSEFQPGRHLLGLHCASTRARALLAFGRVDEALTVSRSAVAQTEPEDRRPSLIDVTLALAEAAAGDLATAAKRLDRLIEDERIDENLVALTLFHEARAKVARQAGDTTGVEAHLARMGEWAHATENTALIARWKSLQTELQSERRLHVEATT